MCVEVEIKLLTTFYLLIFFFDYFYFFMTTGSLLRLKGMTCHRDPKTKSNSILQL